jgi:hypothetical protein
VGAPANGPAQARSRGEDLDLGACQARTERRIRGETQADQDVEDHREPLLLDPIDLTRSRWTPVHLGAPIDCRAQPLQNNTPVETMAPPPIAGRSGERITNTTRTAMTNGNTGVKRIVA